MNDKQILAGELLLVAVFVFAGPYKLLNVDFFAAYWSKAGIPAASAALVIVLSLIELACAVAIAVGFKVRLAASILLVFLVVAIAVFDDFWNASGDAFFAKLEIFFLYLSIVGGLLMLRATGPGRYAVERA
ncbi:DoxX family protein [Microvirga sp. CF3016]|uniref:DoxX family protein n=1 Tax=Microvirga sp. CF3016 TaxID=3110181 RepID=UPI002E76B55F|nr:DoxX family protein [Microvirga sp. CF3016]MEE1611234.1 DoxX family protein [Microvirga sp. CF3016]